MRASSPDSRCRCRRIEGGDSCGPVGGRRSDQPRHPAASRVRHGLIGVVRRAGSRSPTCRRPYGVARRRAGRPAHPQIGQGRNRDPLGQTAYQADGGVEVGGDGLRRIHRAQPCLPWRGLRRCCPGRGGLVSGGCHPAAGGPVGDPPDRPRCRGSGQRCGAATRLRGGETAGSPAAGNLGIPGAVDGREQRKSFGASAIDSSVGPMDAVVSRRAGRIGGRKRECRPVFGRERELRSAIRHRFAQLLRPVRRVQRG